MFCCHIIDKESFLFQSTFDDYYYDCARIKAKGQCDLFADKCTKTCGFCHNGTSSIGDCFPVECQYITDNNGNPYECKKEAEALNWHKECYPQSDDLCRYDGKVYCFHIEDYFLCF